MLALFNRLRDESDSEHDRATKFVRAKQNIKIHLFERVTHGKRWTYIMNGFAHGIDAIVWYDVIHADGGNAFGRETIYELIPAADVDTHAEERRKMLNDILDTEDSAFEYMPVIGNA